jgi:hypothetical protein
MVMVWAFKFSGVFRGSWLVKEAQGEVKPCWSVQMAVRYFPDGGFAVEGGVLTGCFWAAREITGAMTKSSVGKKVLMALAIPIYVEAGIHHTQICVVNGCNSREGFAWRS